MHGTININFPLAHTFIPVLNSRCSVNVTTSYPLTSKFGSHEALPLCLCYVLFTDNSTTLNMYRCYGHPKAKYKVNIKLSLCTPSNSESIGSFSLDVGPRWKWSVSRPGRFIHHRNELYWGWRQVCTRTFYTAHCFHRRHHHFWGKPHFLLLMTFSLVPVHCSLLGCNAFWGAYLSVYCLLLCCTKVCHKISVHGA